MWRDRLIEIKKEKGISTKLMSDRSGISVDTIARILNHKNDKNDSPRLDTISELCQALGVEMWEIFYMGDQSLVTLQAEILALKTERDNLLSENGELKYKLETLRNTVDTLKDEIIATHHYYIKHQTDK